MAKKQIKITKEQMNDKIISLLIQDNHLVALGFVNALGHETITEYLETSIATFGLTMPTIKAITVYYKNDMSEQDLIQIGLKKAWNNGGAQ